MLLVDICLVEVEDGEMRRWQGYVIFSAKHEFPLLGLFSSFYLDCVFSNASVITHG